MYKQAFVNFFVLTAAIVMAFVVLDQLEKSRTLPAAQPAA